MSGTTPAIPADDFSALYSKALVQDYYGVVNANIFKSFRNQLTSGTPNPGFPLLENQPMLGGTVKLNGPQAAFATELSDQAPSSYVNWPAPPSPSSESYAVELIELYWASLLRDVPFSEFCDAKADGSCKHPLVEAACNELTTYVSKHTYAGPTVGGKVTAQVLFRGGGYPITRQKASGTADFFAGETVGPYLSQLCLWPTKLGALSIDQKYQTNLPGQDFMTDLAEWYAVQQGKAAAGKLNADPTPRYLRDGRSLAAYTHVDELYQAYLLAYLVLESWNLDFNAGSPYHRHGLYANQQPFGTLGGPDIIGTLGAVAKEAINAVWWQKWAKFLRHRPEAGGGLLELQLNQPTPPSGKALPQTKLPALLANSAAVKASKAKYNNYLLSQAFPEGSPPHPAYPTGHGAVAGACITALKFFYNCEVKVSTLVQPMMPASDGLSLVPYTGADVGDMDVNGELHKLAHNISFGHGIHAGIHWRSDTDESILFGEKVAINFLRKQKKLYKEDTRNTIITISGEQEDFTGAISTSYP